MSIALDILLALLWMVGAAVMVLAVHALVRRVLPPPSPLADAPPPADGHDYPLATREAATAVGLRLAALYGVLLALVYAQGLNGFHALRDGMAREAGALSDVYHDAGRYGGPVAPVVQSAVREYIHFVVDEEWRSLAREQRLSQAGWMIRDRAYHAALDLDPQTPREHFLRDRMLRRIGDIAEYRRLRQELAAQDFGGVFWLPALAGLVLVAGAFFVFPPTRELRWMLGGFGAFAGLVLFFIQAFGSPFQAPLQDPPGAFERLLETEIGQPSVALDR